MAVINYLLFTTLLLITIHIGVSRTTTQRTFDKVRLDKEGFDKVRTIHYNWYLHSIKAIMGQLGKDLLPKLDTNNRRQFLRCLNAITDKRDVVSAAKCLTEAKESHEEKNVKSSSLEKLPAIDGNHGSKNFIKSPSVMLKRKNPLYTNKSSMSKMSSSSVNDPPRLLIFSKRNHKRKYKNFLQKIYKRRLESAKQKLRRYRPRRVKRSPHRLVIDKISKSDTNGFQKDPTNSPGPHSLPYSKTLVQKPGPFRKITVRASEPVGKSLKMNFPPMNSYTLLL